MTTLGVDSQRASAMLLMADLSTRYSIWPDLRSEWKEGMRKGDKLTDYHPAEDDLASKQICQATNLVTHTLDFVSACSLHRADRTFFCMSDERPS